MDKSFDSLATAIERCSLSTSENSSRKPIFFTEKMTSKPPYKKTTSVIRRQAFHSYSLLSSKYPALLCTVHCQAICLIHRELYYFFFINFIERTDLRMVERTALIYASLAVEIEIRWWWCAARRCCRTAR